MTIKDIAQSTGFSIAAGAESLTNDTNHIFACDLLSLVMGRAQAGDIWVTVMGNMNAVAVAVLADVACIVLAEGVQMDEAGIAKAAEQDVPVLYSPLPVYETIKKIELAMMGGKQ